MKNNDNRKILIVEDNDNLGDTLVEYLQEIGHQAELAKDLNSARKIFSTLRPNIVLLDIGLPDGSGLALATELRAIRKDFVLLFLSAQNDPDTKVQGFETGADDYITKPFALKELIMRLDKIHALQSFGESAPDQINIGKLIIWFKKYEVQDGNGNIIALSQKENAILEILHRNIEDVCDRDKIIESVWGKNKFPSNRTVDNYIVKLRKWTETDPSGRLQILSIRGIGYKLTNKVKE
jgi:two-component system, OmpR family, alkaline phosphatase synthesis response regulator PhoP